MSDEEFQDRWMTLSYDRQKHQGKTVFFPDDVEASKRIAYGRNGIGRHGMLCFADEYTVETWKDGLCNIYDIKLSSGVAPFIISNHVKYERPGHGTIIKAVISRHLPDAESMTDILSARFLYDPKFLVSINDVVLNLSNHKGNIFSKEINTSIGVDLSMIVIDSARTAAKSQQHGIAFWLSGRLVGQPSWTYGDITFLDGRYKEAKRYTIIIETDGLLDEVLPDWSGFANSDNMKILYRELKTEIDSFLREQMKDRIDEGRKDVINDVRDDLETLNVSGKRNVSHYIEKVTTENPMVSPEFLNNSVKAIISIEKAKKGEILLDQLSQMSPDQLDKLSDILDAWDVEDIATVIGEIDRRLVVIEAIQRISDDKNTDELHTLHPMVLNSRWLFGAQYDSQMFASNRALSTVIKNLFKDEDYDLDELNNPRRRPDIVCLNNFSLKAVCTERIDQATEIMKPDQILIIEVKRGGFEITDQEISQAENYVYQIRHSAVPHSSATIDAFVVGAKIGPFDPDRKTNSGTIHATTYGLLVETANTKLFRLRNQLQKHYDDMDQQSIVEKALNTPKQLPLI